MPTNFNYPRDGGKKQFLWEQWPSVFEPPQSMFAPGEPLSPVEQEQVRSYDFPVGINQIIYPRVPETFGFSELRAFSNVELVRLAIETRKDQIERLDWQIKPREDKKTRKDSIERVRAAEKFFQHPNQYEDFHVWLRVIIEDVLVLDAPAIEKQRTRGGDLAALQHVPGDTIKCLVDSNGRRPLPPVPAYQQIIKGRVWANLTSDDLIYAPRNPRSGKLYGLSPVEQCIVTINTVMRRQASQLAYFSDGTIPAGMATVPDGWTVDQTKDWQEWMDANFGGNLAERRKILWAPAGSKYAAFKEPPLKDEFDEWVARIVCYAFSLPPTPFIRQMNRSTAQADTERAMEEGLAPLLVWTKRLADRILHEELGFRDLEFSWNNEKEVDVKTQADINNLYLRAAVVTIDEVRDTMGLDPLANGEGKIPLIYTAGGAMTIDMVLNPPEPVLAGPGGASAGGNKPQSAAEKPKPKAEDVADKRIADLAEIVGGLEKLRKPLFDTLKSVHYQTEPLQQG